MLEHTIIELWIHDHWTAQKYKANRDPLSGLGNQEEGDTDKEVDALGLQRCPTEELELAIILAVRERAHCEHEKKQLLEDWEHIDLL